MIDATHFKQQAFDDEEVLHTVWPSEEVRESKPISRVNVLPKARMLEIVWADGERQEYPTIWLRDHCRCSFCFHAEFQARMTDFMDIDLDHDVGIKSAVVTEGGQLIDITWANDHFSRYPSYWLMSNRFDLSSHEPVSRTEPKLWDGSIWDTDSMRTFSYSDISLSDTLLREMLKQLKMVGVAIIQGAPSERGHMTSFGNRIGYIMNSSYGFTSQIYSSAGWAFGHPHYGLEYRPLHTDYSYCMQPPGVALFHCIDQIPEEGGALFFSDAFKAAYELKEKAPRDFERLTKACWESRVKGWVTNDMHYHHSVHAPITINEHGDVTKMVLDDFWRTSVMRLPVEEVNPTYEAMRALYNLLYRNDHICTYKQQPGDIILFDNHRIVHGRHAYPLTATDTVHLETCYFDWDSVDSRLRKLSMTVSQSDINNLITESNNNNNSIKEANDFR